MNPTILNALLAENDLLINIPFDPHLLLMYYYSHLDLT